MLVRHDYHVSTDRRQVVEVRQAALASGRLSPSQQPLIQRRMGKNGVEYALTVLAVGFTTEPEPTLH